MPGQDVVAIGASAGGLSTLCAIVADLPRELPASLFVVTHVAATSPSSLPDLLSRSGPLPAIHPSARERVRPGVIYVAPPNHHLVLEDDHVMLGGGPRVNGFRPSIDVLFRSVARSRGPRAAGLVLSGLLADGTLGLKAIKAAGGVALVHDPEEAAYASMPSSAIRNVDVDRILRLSEIAGCIAELAQPSRRTEMPAVSEDDGPSADKNVVSKTFERQEAGLRDDRPSVYTCPGCGGVLWEMHDGDVYECHVGHMYSAAAMLEQQGTAVEHALWAAVQALEERASFLRRTIAHMAAGGLTPRAGVLEEQLAEANQRVLVIRRALESPLGIPEETATTASQSSTTASQSSTTASPSS